MSVNESVENSSGPFFGMEVEEFDSAFILNFVNIGLELRIAGPSNRQHQIHPITQQRPDLMGNLIMYNFPQYFHNQIDNFLITILLHQIKQQG